MHSLHWHRNQNFFSVEPSKTGEKKPWSLLHPVELGQVHTGNKPHPFFRIFSTLP